MIGLALKVTAVLVLAALLDIALRRPGSAFARHLIWTMTVFVLLALPLGSIVLPAWRVLPSGVWRAAAPAESSLASTPEVRLPQTLPTVRESAPPAAPPTVEQPAVMSEPARAAIDWTALAFFAYAGIALVLLLRIAAEHFLVARFARRGEPLISDEWSVLVRSTCAHLGVRRTVDLRAVSGTVMPVACGIIRSRVLLPAAAEEWPVERRSAVLLHEIAHVARHDCLTQTMAAVACALYWPHPGVWWAAHRLRVEREHACDALAVAGGVPRLEYAAHLLEIARAYAAPRYAAGAVAMARSRIERRLRALLAMDMPERPLSRQACSATVLAALALLVALAAMAPAASAAPEPLAPSGRDIDAAIVRSDAQAGASGLTPPALSSGRTAGPASGEGEPFTGTWALRRATAREPSAGRVTVHLALRAPGLNTQYLPLEAFAGVSESLFEGEHDARFTLTVGPGTFRFDGAFANGRGAGRFGFTPDHDFARALLARGMAEPSDSQLFQLARHGMGSDFLDSLAVYGYPQPTTEAFVRTSLTGVDASLLRELAARGRRFASLEDLIHYWNNRSSYDESERASAPAESPTRAAPPVAPSPSATPTTGRWRVSAMRGGGHLLELFWDDSTQWRRRFDPAEFTSIPGTRTGTWLIQRDAGRLELTGSGTSSDAAGTLLFVPNRAFAATLKELGLTRREGEVPDHDLKNLTWGNVGEREVRRFRTQFDTLAYDDVVSFAIRAISPEYVDAMRALGVLAPAAQDVIDLGFAEITTIEVRALIASGHTDMSAASVRRALRHRPRR